MNLIEDAWIPARRKDGSIEKIAPWQITAGKGKKYMELAASRPDFNGALIQFLIGLLQTTCAPKNNKQWREWLNNPPIPEELKKQFSSVTHAFELDGDGPRFMQELGINEMSNSVIGSLLLETPGENTLANNADHFIKRGLIKSLCPSCAASALLTLQINAPSGGRGHRTGIRGGGPLTTLIISNNLWESCWSNVLDKTSFTKLANGVEQGEDKRFPWLAHTPSSEGENITSMQDVSPDQIYWAMPRRIKLFFEDSNNQCDLCGLKGNRFIKQFWTKPYGINYGDSGLWRHPLSPYRLASSQQASSIKPQADGISYRHWLGLVQASSNSKGQRLPAEVINNFISTRRGRRSLRLWSFGFDMDNMKARCWYDSTMPLVLAEASVREEYENHIANMVYGSQLVAWQTRTTIKKALFDRPGDVKGDFSFVDSRFYKETEDYFFDNLSKLRTLVEGKASPHPVLEKWHIELASKAEEIFDDLSQTGAFEVADPKRIALAWHDLSKNIQGKKVREQLGLPT